jgi:hypothetical protein
VSAAGVVKAGDAAAIAGGRPASDAEVEYARRRIADLEYGIAEGQRIIEGTQETIRQHKQDLVLAKAALRALAQARE